MRSRFVRRTSAAVASLALVALAGCGGDSSDTESDSSSDSKSGGGSSTTLTVAWTATPTQMDPNVFTGLTWLYALDASMATLLEYDTDLPDDQLIGTDDVVPSLAESWEASEDETSYTMKLREGVKSPYGNEFTADDVIYSFDRIYSNPAGLQAGILLATANVDAENPIEKIDDYTIKYNLTAPSAVALSVLAYPLDGILDSTEVEKHATKDDPWASEWLAQNTAGFGPYQMSSMDPGVEIRFESNPNYFGEKSFENLIIRAVPDGSSRAQLLTSGEVDVISEPPIDQLDTINDSSTARVSEMPDTNRHNLTLSQSSKTLSNPLVRQAINHAIDRQGIVDSVYQGHAQPAMTPVTSTLFDDQPVVGEYDPEMAKRLLDEAGLGDGFDMTLTFSTERPGPYAETLARLIQSDLGKIGIEAKLEAVPSVADFEAGVSDKKYEAYLYSERPAQPEIGYDLFLYLFGTSPLNKSGYANGEFDAVVTDILTTVSGPERDAEIGKALDLLAEDGPLVSLVEVPDLAGVANSIEGFSAIPSGGVMFQDLKRG